MLFDKQNPKEDRTSERDFCPTLGFDVKKIPLVYLESSSPGRLYFLFLLAGKKGGNKNVKIWNDIFSLIEQTRTEYFQSIPLTHREAEICMALYNKKRV